MKHIDFKHDLPDNGDHNKRLLRDVVMSFSYAFNGLFYVLVTQRNMRFHFCMALWVMSFAVILGLPDMQKAFLFMIVSFVFAMEVLNTCIENLTNLLSPDYSRWARIAKDTAAAAVLVVSIGSLMAAGYLLIGPFFDKLLDPAFWTNNYGGITQLTAVAMIVGSVLGFWFTRALQLPMRVFLIPCCGAAAFAIAHISVKGGDWIAFFAMLFFSFLLFNSLTKLKTSPRLALAGHVLGLIAYLIVYKIVRLGT